MTTREPLLLLHGLGMSARVWDGVLPWLAPHHEVLALTTLGHRGGPAAASRPVSVRELVDDVERRLDENGLDRPHVAGNSLGGWMAIELARRGLARSVCALSPAGSWTAGTAQQTDSVRRIRRMIWMARLSRPLPMRLLLRSDGLRRLVMRDVAEHGEHLTPAELLEGTRDLLGCTIAEDLLTTAEELPPLDPLPCPITLAWSSHDALLPAEVNGAVARARLPQASYVELGGVGHVPMIDDPARVATTIQASTSGSGRWAEKDDRPSTAR